MATKLDKGNNMSKKNALLKSQKKPTDKDDRGKTSALPGWPGYRTREGRSGYDPIDTRTEAAHVSGTFLQKLFTGQLKISNPLYLFLVGALGLVLVAPLVLAVVETLNGNPFSRDGWILLLIAGIVGLAVLINFIKNLIRIIK